MELRPDFVESLHWLLPAAEASALAEALARTAPAVSVRVNTRRPGLQVPAGVRRVAWMPESFYCEGRPAFTFDPRFHAGHYYVQDASSMFVGHVLRALLPTDRPVRYLDLCAAPGGKATAALQALPEGSLLVANEYVSARAQVLAANVQRWGHENAVVTNASPEQFGHEFPDWFDVVAADVPCSGEGMMRKDAEAAAQWSPALVEQCAARQRGIIDDVWPALRPGGLLLYSTCTFNRAENEAVVEYLMEQYGVEPVAVGGVEPSWGISPAVGASWPAYRFLPHRVEGEGLFLAVVRKPATELVAQGGATGRRARGGGAPAVGRDVRSVAEQWLDVADDFVLQPAAGGASVEAVPRRRADDVSLLRTTLRVLTAGVPLAVAKGRGVQPHPALAWSLRRRSDAFAVAEVDYAAAVAYLRGESVPVSASLPRGLVLTAFGGAALGFANNVGNRANNLYPKSLRILSTHVPVEPPRVLAPVSD